jgi:hypothetical protein
MMSAVGSTYDAENFKSDIIGDKLKVTFTIKDREKASLCFKDFQEKPYLNQGKDRSIIFFLKPENIFE